jgi:hypothetical protein
MRRCNTWAPRDGKQLGSLPWVAAAALAHRHTRSVTHASTDDVAGVTWRQRAPGGGGAAAAAADARRCRRAQLVDRDARRAAQAAHAEVKASVRNVRTSMYYEPVSTRGGSWSHSPQQCQQEFHAERRGGRQLCDASLMLPDTCPTSGRCSSQTAAPRGSCPCGAGARPAPKQPAAQHAPDAELNACRTCLSGRLLYAQLSPRPADGWPDTTESP